MAHAGAYEASFVPALLLFLVWTLVASVYLARRSSGQTAPVGGEAAAAA